MCKIICITNRALCRGDFLTQLARIAAAEPDAVILREKDLPEPEYAALAAQVMPVCKAHGVPLVLHSYPQTALALGADYLHLPLPVLLSLPEAQRKTLPRFGVSCHSEADGRQAEECGAAYLIAGHIFATDCKRGLPGRGTDFLRKVCRSTALPVFAIGGIAPENCGAVKAAGAAGICVMSGLMQSGDPAAYLQELRGAL